MLPGTQQFQGQPGIPPPQMYMPPSHQPPSNFSHPSLHQPLPNFSHPLSSTTMYIPPSTGPDSYTYPSCQAYNEPVHVNANSWYTNEEVPAAPTIKHGYFETHDPSLAYGFACPTGNNNSAIAYDFNSATSVNSEYTSISTTTVSPSINVARSTSYGTNESNITTIFDAMDSTPEHRNESKEEAIQMELKNQKLTLFKELSEYEKESDILKRHLELLKQQKQELLIKNLSGKDDIIKQNAKLQDKVIIKLKAISNAIDLLTEIIGDVGLKKGVMSYLSSTPSKVSYSKSSKVLTNNRSLTYLNESKFQYRKRTHSPRKYGAGCQSEKKYRARSRSLTPTTASIISDGKSYKSVYQQSPGSSVDETELVAVSSSQTSESAPAVKNKPQFNFIHYDPEIHWCRICNVFPKTAKDYLIHLHCIEHKNETKKRKIQDLPWHITQPQTGTSVKSGLPTQRVPIRGLQFFVPATTTWYCKLCDIWMGDLHCASQHLKSYIHSKMYNSFTKQYPNWEFDWISTRTRAFERRQNEERQMEGSAQLNLSSSFSGDHVRFNNARAAGTRNLQDELQEEVVTIKSNGSLAGSHSSLKQSNKEEYSNRISCNDGNREKILSKSVGKQLIVAMNASKKSKLCKTMNENSGKSQPSRGDSSSSESKSERKDLEKRIDVMMKKNSKNAEVKEIKKNVIVMNVNVPDTKSKHNSLGKEMPNISKEPIGKMSNKPSKQDKLLKEWMRRAVNEKDKDIISSMKGRLKLHKIDRKVKRIKAKECHKNIRERRHLDEARVKFSEEDSNKKSIDTVKNDIKMNQIKLDKFAGDKQIWIHDMDDSNNEIESIFEKPIVESMKNVKKFQMNMPKRLPFINRIPLMDKGGTINKRKYKHEGTKTTMSCVLNEPAIKSENYANINKVFSKGLVCSDLHKQIDANSSQLIQLDLPRSMISLSKTDDCSKQVIKMELCDEIVQGKRDKLLKDFQNALNILFPTENEEENSSNHPSVETSEKVQAGCSLQQSGVKNITLQTPLPLIIGS